jgi:hypothetical protein
MGSEADLTSFYERKRDLSSLSTILRLTMKAPGLFVKAKAAKRLEAKINAQQHVKNTERCSTKRRLHREHEPRLKVPVWSFLQVASAFWCSAFSEATCLSMAPPPGHEWLRVE